MADHASVHYGARIGTMLDYCDLGGVHLNAQRKLLRSLQALLQGRVLDTTLATPPGAPVDGDAYIVAASPTGAWVGHANHVAVWAAQKATDDTNTKVPAWEFYTPKAGWMLWDEDSDTFFVYDGAAWGALATGSTITLKTDGTPNVSQTILDLISGANITITDNGDGTVTIAGSGGGASAFTDLTDAPASYTGHAGKQVVVNSTEDGVEFRRRGKVDIRTVSGTTDTLVLADSGNSVKFTSSSAVTATVPPNSSVAFEVGQVITLVQYGSGQVTFSPGSGVTINKRSGLNAKAAGQYAVVQIKKIATDEWLLFGDLEVA
jgi:hypothetical protein